MPASLAPPRAPRRIDLGVPDETDQPPITDAAATDLSTNPVGLSLSSGYTTTPVAPQGVMGGETTRPDDFGQKVQAATAVESKGGPPASELSAKAGRGAVREGLNAPREGDQAAAPETKKPPKGVLLAPKVERAQPVTTPTPTPSPTPAATPAPTPAQPAQPQQEVPPSLQDQTFRANLDKYGGKDVLGDNQDYSGLDPAVTQNREFAGLAKNGRPVFFDRGKNRFYIKDDTAPGTEVRYYQGALPGTKEFEGLTVTDESKANFTRDAQVRLANVLQAMNEINGYEQQVQKFKDSGAQDLNPLQRQILATQMGGNQNPFIKGFADWVAPGMGISKEIYDLEGARNRVANTAGMGITKNLPETERSMTALELPNAADPLDIQERKIANVKTALLNEVATMKKMYPYANPWLKDAEEQILKQGGGRTGAGNQNAPARPTERPSPTPTATPSATPARAATPSATPTGDERRNAKTVNTQQEYDALPNGALYRDSTGVLRRKGS